MRKQTIGEWILQLVTSPERAAAIVGDLDESGVSAMRFWLAIGSNILHAISLDVLTAAAKGCLAQFVFPLPVALVLGYADYHSWLSYTQWRWAGVLLILGVQILTGIWITRQRVKQPVLICLLVVIADCTLGLSGGHYRLWVNNASINMSIWAIPLLVTTAAIVQRRRRVTDAPKSAI